MSIVENDLTKYDFIIAIDRSASMGDVHKSTSRWEAAEESTIGLARQVEKFDDDGIDVVLFNDRVKYLSGVKSSDVSRIFQETSPMGGTDTTGLVLEVAKRYFERKAKGNAKPVICQVITDGRPENESTLQQAIIDISRKLDRDEELSFQFIQYGNDKRATDFLKNLDDNLVSKGAKFDIVDTITADELGDMTIVDLLLKAVND